LWHHDTRAESPDDLNTYLLVHVNDYKSNKLGSRLPQYATRNQDQDVNGAYIVVSDRVSMVWFNMPTNTLQVILETSLSSQSFIICFIIKSYT